MKFLGIDLRREPNKSDDRLFHAFGTRLSGENSNVTNALVEHQLSFRNTEARLLTVARTANLAIVVGYISNYAEGPLNEYRLPRHFVQYIRPHGSIHTEAYASQQLARFEAFTSMPEGSVINSKCLVYESYPALVADIQASWLEQAHADVDSPVVHGKS